MIIIGITGAIGSGKSVVSQIFTCMGIPVFDTDTEAKNLYIKSVELKKYLIDLVGPSVYKDGNLDKKYLADKIFSNTALLHKIEAYIHPLVKTEFEIWCKNQRVNVVALESAILYSSKFNSLCDKIIWVDAPLEERLNRVVVRDNLTREEVEKRNEKQNTIPPELPSSHFYILKNGKNDSVLEQIESFFKEINYTIYH